MRFDGKARAEALPSSELAPPALSVALWVKIESFDSSLFPLDKSVWMQSGWYLKYHQPADEFYAEVFDGGSERRVAHFTGVKPGVWTHLAFVADGTSLSAYVDGALTERVPAGPVVTNGLPLIVGKNCPGVSLRDLRLWTGALSPAQVTELASEG